MLVQRFNVKVIGGIFRKKFSIIQPTFVTLEAGLFHPGAVFIYRVVEISVFQTCLQIQNLHPFFRKEELITETKAVKNDKPFLLSALLSVGSFKRCCSHGSLWLAGLARSTAGFAQFAMPLLRWMLPDKSWLQLVDLSWLVPSPPPMPFFCLSDLHKPDWHVGKGIFNTFNTLTFNKVASKCSSSRSTVLCAGWTLLNSPV